MTELKQEYDIIIIGSGLGGLTAANRLARMGHSVLLLEQHFKLGGLATWFNRKGHIFDVSLHGFPHGMVKTCRKYWTKEIANMIVPLRGIRFDNPQFNLETTFTRIDFTKLLIERFGIKPEVADAFFTKARAMNFYDEQELTTRELFEEFFPGRKDVVRLLMEPITYANGSSLNDPAITYGIVFSNFMSKGVFTFEGGTDKLINMMEEELVKNGVHIEKKATATKILVENGKASGVVFNNKAIKAKAVVSNANLISTILHMTGEEHFSAEFAEKVKKVRLNNSSCQVYIGLKEGEKLDYMGDLLFTSTADEFDYKKICSRNITSRTYSIYYPKTRPGHDRYSIVASTNANYEDWDLPKEEYKASKKELVEDTLTALEKYVPNIRNMIDYVEAATPKTFERYTLHLGGASFGTKFEGLNVSSGLHKELSGLFHTGSAAIIMSGWLGAANYGAIISNDVDKYVSGIK